MGYFLYYLNKFFFKNEVYPSKLKIFIWDKLFTPLTVIADFLFRAKYNAFKISKLKKDQFFLLHQTTEPL